ncbi:putative ATPase family associated with various cellular activities (AAA) [Monocercomonoides exilis]|uniref:putative ATPase family associated with various cellular activities (AAA) n=1 Tax=Monocercomonoides exilis TaxID=2049356 RepID=UPI00355A088E|nr:putative ATPase family associated with various cellular activities (AAA) [Monocercomonoides exilis]|eukprot:MONOS_750.1-p1 / transcript=MONOS_750.1 / gene=MONOS_750 / organism=Monocercomonoides_exilis_PA203 / gene_product=ATPase family associated with various cellular activities (AAA) / transcript_product=ATPase family associated with various cellular activities (AAA) / location=Mono_scaffold00012:233322-235975(-) / protein_length=810 / sequence_SO=supercontig / SO=protein_coding / is_pseudo=false
MSLKTDALVPIASRICFRKFSFLTTPGILLYVKKCLSGLILTVGMNTEISFLGKKRTIHIYSANVGDEVIERGQKFKINETTEILFSQAQEEKQKPQSSPKSENTKLSSISGQERVISVIKETILASLTDPLFFVKFGLKPPRSILLFGPPGTGKTMIARATALEAGANLISISGTDFSYGRDAKDVLQTAFLTALSTQPSLIFFDELDLICPSTGTSFGSQSGGSGTQGLSQKIVNELCSQLDSLSPTARVAILGATNNVDRIDSALLRGGRFDRQLEVGVPTEAERKEILFSLMKGEVKHDTLENKQCKNEPGSKSDACLQVSQSDQRSPFSLSDEQIAMVAERAHGFVAADLCALCQAASVYAIHRFRREEKAKKEKDSCLFHSTESSSSSSAPLTIPRDTSSLDENSSTNTSSLTQKMAHLTLSPTSEDVFPSVTLDDVSHAFQSIRPSAMRDIAVSVEPVRWSDIGGEEDVKKKVREVVEWPLLHPEAFQRMGIRAPRGILLFGPPGCSKTMMARAVATESGMNFLSVKGPELFSKWVGESEKAIHTLFSRARTLSPAVVFFDEVDAIAGKRKEGGGGVTDRVLSQLLMEMDGVTPLTRVVVMAATNRPDVLDAAFLRPGRIDRMVFVPPPDEEGRAAIFKSRTKRIINADTEDEKDGIESKNVESNEKKDENHGKFDWATKGIKKKDNKIPIDDDVDIEQLSKMTDSFSGAEVVALCREASLCAIREEMNSLETPSSNCEQISDLHQLSSAQALMPLGATKKQEMRVCMRHFIGALKTIAPQITKEMMSFYYRFIEDNKDRAK